MKMDMRPKSKEEKRAVLRSRAKELAKVTEKEASQSDLTEIILFRLASETYGLETGFVREVFPLNDFTPLPGTPPFVLGVINVRGQIVSVLNIKKFFELPETGISELNKLIIIRNDEMEFGILADEILEIRTIEPGELHQSLPTLSGIREKYLKGITAGPLIILDVAKLLMDENIIINEEVAMK